MKRTRGDPPKKKRLKNYKEEAGESCERTRGDEAGGKLEDVEDGIRVVPQY